MLNLLVDLVPEDVAIWVVVANLWNGRAGGSGGVKVGHIKDWLRGMREEKN